MSGKPDNSPRASILRTLAEWDRQGGIPERNMGGALVALALLEVASAIRSVHMPSTTDKAGG